MRKYLNIIVAATFAVALLLIPITAAADEQRVSDVATGATTNVDLQLDIPSYIEFKVGSAGIAVDTVTFTVPFASAANNIAIAGDITLNVVLKSNAGGDVTITESNDTGAISGLLSGTDNVGLAKISTTSPLIPAPILSDGGGNTSTVISSGGLIDETDIWSYEFANGAMYKNGSYSARITYVASFP